MRSRPFSGSASSQDIAYKELKLIWIEVWIEFVHGQDIAYKELKLIWIEVWIEFVHGQDIAYKELKRKRTSLGITQSAYGQDIAYKELKPLSSTGMWQ